jgi:hypothetical protein
VAPTEAANEPSIIAVKVAPIAVANALLANMHSVVPVHSSRTPSR